MQALAKAFRRSADKLAPDDTHAADGEGEGEVSEQPRASRAIRTPGAATSVVVVVQTDKTSGEVRVVEVAGGDGGAVPFVVRSKEQRDVAQAPNNKAVFDFAPKRTSAEARKALYMLRKHYIAVLPWNNLTVAPLQYPTGAVYVLDQSEVPSHSFFPVGAAYASGFTMVEVEPVIDRALGLTLTSDWLSQKSVTETVLRLRATLRGDNEPQHLPGLVLHDTVEHLRKHSSPTYEGDPLLNTWKVDYVKTHAQHLRLQPGDHVGMYVSEWGDVTEETKNFAGHKKDTKHYYVVVKYTLPVETVDQLRHVLYENPLKDPWGAFVKRKVFSRAEEVAAAVRETKLRETLQQLGLRAKLSNPDVVHTVFNVFDGTSVNVNVRISDEDAGEHRMVETEGVTFYSNCVPTHRCARGCLIERGPDRDDGLLWLHGPQAGTLGGTQWKQPASVSSLPCTGFNEKLKKTQLKAFESAGWDIANGFAKLDAVFFV